MKQAGFKTFKRHIFQGLMKYSTPLRLMTKLNIFLKSVGVTKIIASIKELNIWIFGFEIAEIMLK